MVEVKAQIAAAVRTARKRQGLSQQEVADAIGTTLETVSKCERGTSAPSAEVLLALIRVLQLDVADLTRSTAARAPMSTKRARLEAEVMATAREMTDAQLELLSEFAGMLGRWKG